MSGFLVNEKTGLMFSWTPILAKKRNLRTATKAEEEAYLATFPKNVQNKIKKLEDEGLIMPDNFDPYTDISKLNLIALKAVGDNMPGFRYSQKDKVGALRASLQEHLDKLKGLYDPNRIDELNDVEVEEAE